jgi:hypothetical protein
MFIAQTEPDGFNVDEDRLYIDLRLSWTYRDPRVQPSGNWRGRGFETYSCSCSW